MTDRLRVKSLLDDFGTIYREEGEEYLEIMAKDGPKQVGYSNFVTVFTFEDDGSFKMIGIWE